MKIEVGSVGIQGFPYLIIVSAWDQHELVGDRIFLDDIAFEILCPDQCGGSSLKRYAHDGMHMTVTVFFSSLITNRPLWVI